MPYRCLQRVASNRTTFCPKTTMMMIKTKNSRRKKRMRIKRNSTLYPPTKSIKPTQFNRLPNYTLMLTRLNSNTVRKRITIPDRSRKRRFREISKSVRV